MSFKQFYTWIKYKTLPPSCIAKNTFFIERDSKKTRIFNNLALTFRNERWTNWESSHVDWAWVDLFILMSKYFFSFVFFLLLWFFYRDFLICSPLYNVVAYKIWSVYEFFNYYSLFLVWVYFLMKSFVWDTFIVVLLSGHANHYYPLARREEGARIELNQMPKIVKLKIAYTPFNMRKEKCILWVLANVKFNHSSINSLLSNPKFDIKWLFISRNIYRIHFLINSIENHVPPSVFYFYNFSINNFSCLTNNFNNVSLPRFFYLPQYSNIFVNSFNFQPSLHNNFVLNNIVSKYIYQFSLIAKLTRYYSLMTPSNTFAPLALRFNSVVKSFLQTQFSWLNPDIRNIWLKSSNSHFALSYNQYFNFFRFNGNVSNGIFNRELNPTLPFYTDSSFIWCVKRMFFSNFYNFSLLYKSPLSMFSISPSSCLSPFTNNFPFLSAVLLSPSYLPFSCLSYSSISNLSLSPSNLDVNWTLWNDDTTFLLSLIYLLPNSSFFPFSYVSCPKHTRIKFRK